MALSALGLSEAEFEELSLVDVAFQVLKAGNKPLYYRDLMNEVATVLGLSTEEVDNVIARLYTEVNMDGRFLCVGNNVWGIKTWYPVDKSVEKSAVGGTKRFIRKETDPYFDDDDDNDIVDAYVEDDEVEENTGIEEPVEDEEADDATFEDEAEVEADEEEDLSFEELEEGESETDDEDEDM